MRWEVPDVKIDQKYQQEENFLQKEQPLRSFLL